MPHSIAEERHNGASSSRLQVHGAVSDVRFERCFWVFLGREAACCTVSRSRGAAGHATQYAQSVIAISPVGVVSPPAVRAVGTRPSQCGAQPDGRAECNRTDVAGNGRWGREWAFREVMHGSPTRNRIGQAPFAGPWSCQVQIEQVTH